MKNTWGGGRAASSVALGLGVIAGTLVSARTQAAQPAVPTVVVTASRIALPAERVVADVVVIDRETIEGSSADSLGDLLRREAGLQLSRNGGPGQSTGVLIRGAAAVNTVVLVDGVRIGSATLGFAQLDGLALSQVERVEVLRGPASSLHGADAVGGVVQIFTRSGSAAPHLAAMAGAGGYGSRDAALHLGGRSAPLELAASLSSQRSRGVSAVRPGDRLGLHNPDADGHALEAAQIRLGLALPAGHRLELWSLQSQLEAQFDSAQFPPPTYVADSRGDYRNHLDTRASALAWQGTIGPGLAIAARVSRSEDDLRSGAAVLERFRTVRHQQMLQMDHRLAETLHATVVLDGSQEAVQASGFDGDARRRNLAAALALSSGAAPLAWQTEWRRDHIEGGGGVSTGRVGASRALGAGWRARALLGSTFRQASFNDLYYPGYGVSGLRPERGRSLEGGLDWKAGPSSASLTVYRNRLRDLIGYERDPSLCPDAPGYAFGCARNIASATLQGASMAGQHEVGRLRLKAAVDFTDAKDDATAQRLNRRAAKQARLDLEWRRAAWTWSVQTLHVGARPDGGAVLPAQTTLDLMAQYHLNRHWRWQFKLLNATDRDVQPVRDYQGLGRQAWWVLRHDRDL